MAARYVKTLENGSMAKINVIQMPLVGFGLWKVNNDTCPDTVYNAIKTGYRLFDGACGNCFQRSYQPNAV